MRIVHLLKHCDQGNGHVHVAVDLACAQAAVGHDVAFVTSGGIYEALLRDHGISLWHIPRLESSVQLPRALVEVTRAARKFKPDIFHAHMMTSAVLGYAVSRGLRKPLVTTMHNSFDRHSGLMRLGDVVVAVSEAERRLLLMRGVPSTKVTTVLNGANGTYREVLKPSSTPVLPSPAIVTLSGLHARKGVVDVIRAFGLVVNDFPEWHLNIVGDGPDRVLLADLIESLKLQASVHLIGSTLYPKGYLEQSQIFASGALAEPFGLAIAEARAAGCAIVATSVGGVPEVLEYGRAGQLTPPSDPEAMAAVFRSLISDPSSRQIWQRRALDGIERLSVEQMQKGYERVYEMLGSRT